MEISEEQLEKVLEKVLNSKRTIDNITHVAHHEFTAAWMIRWEARQKMWQRFKLSFIGGIAMTIVGALIWIGKIVLEHWPKTS